MAPEYVVGGEPGPAADVFALGAVLAYAATGRAPFGTGAPHVVNYRAVHEEPDLTGIPAGLAAQCLTKDPAARPTPDLLCPLLPRGTTPRPSDVPGETGQRGDLRR
ncbi:serine/threonine protein kinase [Streptomyces tendae]|uniref:hypothetical protein n=1 Tax=Streptomyces tendae TaxID=1932 RepID=UPI003836D810